MSQDDLKKRIEALSDFDECQDVECECCSKPLILHNIACTRQEEKLPTDKMLNIQGSFKMQVNLILKIVKKEWQKVVKEDSLEGLKSNSLYRERKHC